MIGTVEFNSSCFYRYANIDVGQLTCNLKGDQELTYRTIEAFLRASVAAIPTGKQNSRARERALTPRPSRAVRLLVGPAR